MKQVFLSMSTDVIHNGHIKIIARAATLGEVTVGVLTDEAVSEYKRFPLVPFEERCEIIENIKGVARVVRQDSVDYENILLELKPDIVVHGDDWRTGFQAPIRQRVIETLATYGGELVEFPYTINESAEALEENARRVLSLPDRRRPRLRQLLSLKQLINVIEAHNGLTGLIAETAKVEKDGDVAQFDAMWISSLCDSTAKGKPDTELVDTTSRLDTINEILEVTTKPIILDGDSGGPIEHFQFFVSTLERIGVSAIIIEDKTGMKRNSLFGDVGQSQDTVEAFSEKIAAGKAVLKTPDFMIVARIESLILDQGMDDALMRARAYVNAGADGVMIHSRKKDPSEIFEFCEKFRAEDPHTPIVVVPTTFNAVTEAEFGERGVNVVIYANHLIRAAFPAMMATAESILTNSRCKEADEELCMPIKDVLTLIPEVSQ
ncbi:MAG: phosphoenolpyruvate mutase [Coriobacteriia bacterium]|nr:phosphoenolpyruvate mutase [Coriobacteriia bacterium]